MPGDEVSRRVRYVDLTLGAWRPREAAFQLAIGLGIGVRPIYGADAQSSPVSADFAALDAEAVGDPTILTAWRDAAAISTALPGGVTVAVLGPRWGLPFRVENEWFFVFLKRRGISIALIGDEVPFSIGKSPFERRRNLAAPQPATHPDALTPEQRRVLRFFPGLLPRDLVERTKMDAGTAGLVPNGGGHFLLAVAWRDRDPRASARELDALGAIEEFDDGLRALAQSFCTSHFADPVVLHGLAGQALSGGSADLAQNLAERARAVARRPEDAAESELRLQEIRLLHRSFGDIAAAPQPSRHASAGVRDAMRRLRALAAVMAGDLATAEREIAALQARLRGGETLGPEDFHFLNAAADARLEKGDIGGAFLIASATAATLSRDSAADFRLVVENALTLARIHRRRGDNADQRAALDRAFAATHGMRTLAEIVEMNVLRASAEAEAQSPEARIGWLRAALAWLAAEPTEAFPRRATLAVLGREVPPGRRDEQVAEALARYLESAWPGLDVKGSHPAVRGAGDSELLTIMLAGPGVAVLWTPAGEVRPPGVSRARLIGLVAAALREVSPRLAGTRSGTFLVDANLGIDIPATREEALSVALRHGAREFAFGEEVVKLDETTRPALVRDLRVVVSTAVARIVEEGGRLTAMFRRAAPRPLSDGEAAAFNAARGGDALGTITGALRQPLDETERQLRRLEADNVVRLDVAKP